MDKLMNFINDSRSGRANFELALEYESMNHYAGAISHFLRCAEFGDFENDKGIIYESLIHLSLCFRKLGNREYVEKGFLLHAISFNPYRREAYWILSQFHEAKKEWQESYTAACIGLNCWEWGDNTLGFEGKYMLLFQKAVSAWWIGRMKESRDLFFALPEYPLNDHYIKHVQNNLSSLGSGSNPFLPYTFEKAENLRFKFDGYENIKKNFSQTYQDMFVLSMLNGKRDGYYLEIGSADPFYGSNTALLETVFDWKGMSIEIKESEVKKFKEQRKNTVVCRDALTINYGAFLAGIQAPEIIDYLQIDCEPPQATYNILLSIPFESYKFRVITFEHDYYADASREIRDLSRHYLKSMGYELLVNNIAPDEKSSFEDWWVHPDLVYADIIEKMSCVNNEVKNAEKYILKNNQEWTF